MILSLPFCTETPCNSNDLSLTKTVWTQTKQFVTVQNNLGGPKSFLTYRRTRHKFSGSQSVPGVKVMLRQSAPRLKDWGKIDIPVVS